MLWFILRHLFFIDPINFQSHPVIKHRKRPRNLDPSPSTRHLTTKIQAPCQTNSYWEANSCCSNHQTKTIFS